MTGGTHSTGAFAAMLFEPGAAPHTFDASSEIYEFLSESVQKHGRIIGGNEITGSRSHRVERTRAGAAYFYGSVLKYFSPAELDTLLPKMIGDNQTPTDTFNMTEDVPYFGILIDRDYSTFEYKDCKVDKWIIRGRGPTLGEDGEPDLLTLELRIIGSNEAVGTSWPGSPPALGTSLAYNPYVFQDTCSTGITIGGSAREVSEFVIVGDNNIEALYTNCLTPYSLMPRDRKIRARFKLPWNSTNSALYDATYTGATASIVLTNSSVSTTFTFGRFQPVAESPIVQGKTAIFLILEGDCTMVTTTRELVVLNDATV